MPYGEQKITRRTQFEAAGIKHANNLSMSVHLGIERPHNAAKAPKKRTAIRVRIAVLGSENGPSVPQSRNKSVAWDE